MTDILLAAILFFTVLNWAQHNRIGKRIVSWYDRRNWKRKGLL